MRVRHPLLRNPKVEIDTQLTYLVLKNKKKTFQTAANDIACKRLEGYFD